MDLEASPAERRQLEYATQHFDFTPASLTDTITSLALENLESVLDGMEAHCSKVFAKKVSQYEMKKSFALLKEKYAASTESVMEEFGLYVQKHVLTVPPNVVLPEDREQQKLSATTEAETGSAAAAATGSSKVTMDDLKKFDAMCENSRGDRYKLAVLQGKLANLQRVRQIQVREAKRAAELAECRRQLDMVVGEETRKLDQKLDKLRKIMATLDQEPVDPSAVEEENRRENRERLAKVECTAAILAKRSRQDSEDSGMIADENTSYRSNMSIASVAAPPHNAPNVAPSEAAPSAPNEASEGESNVAPAIVITPDSPTANANPAAHATPVPNSSESQEGNTKPTN